MEAECAPSSADDADKLVILGGGDVVETLVSALNEHLAALLDDLDETEDKDRFNQVMSEDVLKETEDKDQFNHVMSEDVL